MTGNGKSGFRVTAALFLVPAAIMAPPAALAGMGAGDVMLCSNQTLTHTIRIDNSGIGANVCEVRHDRGDGSGARSLPLTAASTATCLDKADEIVARLAGEGFSCSLRAAGSANEAGPVTPASASGTSVSGASITLAQAESAPEDQAESAPEDQAESAPEDRAESAPEDQAESTSEDEDEFSFEIAETPAPAARPVYSSRVEAGSGWVSEDSAEFGKFSGLNTDGIFAIGEIDIRFRNPNEANSNEYFFLSGTDLGLESRSLHAEYGRQGQFSIFAAFDSIPRYLLDDARTPFVFHDDGTTLLLPAGWVPGNRNIAEMTLLDESLHDVDIDHRREKAGGGFSWLPSDDWSVKSSFYHETKKGTRTVSAIFGSSGGNPAGMIVPEPVDYETDTFDVSVNYAGDRAQAALGYNLSLFRDNNEFLLFQNPYFSASWDPDVSYPNGFGRMGLPPDNWAHRVSFAGSYLLTPQTRATAHVSYGRMRQDEDFLPYTVNPGLLVTTPLPRDSLDGEIVTWTAVLGLSSKVSPKLSLNANYRFEDRDNNTPRDVFIVVPGDSQNQGTIFSSTARINRPYSRRQNLAEIEAAYRLTGKAKLTLGYEYEQLERDFTEVKTTREHKVNSKFQVNPTLRLVAWVGAEYAVRDGSEYIGNLPFLLSQTPEHLGPAPEEEFENHPLLRKFYIADRDRLKVHGTVNWAARDNLNFAVMGRYSDDQYDGTLLGLTDSVQYNVTGDLSYEPREGIDLRLFYTYDNIEHMQTGLSWNSSTLPSDLFNIGLRGWNVDTLDRIHTAGAGIDWVAIKDRLEFKFDYYYSDATTHYDISAGTAIGFAPLPDLDTRLHSFEALAKYQLTDQLALKLRYLFADYDVTDFALDGIDPDSMRFIIGLGNQAPDFNVHVVGVSTVFEF